MAIREVPAFGLEYLAFATELLRRARLIDAEAGLWEAADLQWWWRTPRPALALEVVEVQVLALRPGARCSRRDR